MFIISCVVVLYVQFFLTCEIKLNLIMLQNNSSTRSAEGFQDGFPAVSLFYTVVELSDCQSENSANSDVKTRG